jgi:hypothetical protein
MLMTFSSKAQQTNQDGKLSSTVKSLDIKNKKAVVYLKNGSKENYDLTVASEKNAFEAKYIDLQIVPPAAPNAPTAVPAPALPTLPSEPATPSLPNEASIQSALTTVPALTSPATLTALSKLPALPALKALPELPVYNGPNNCSNSTQ